MTARPLTPDDVDWLVDVLQVRRERLVPHAPVFWRPAADAADRHRAWLGHLLGDGGALGWRTDDAALVAAPRQGAGRLLDDVVVPGDDWDRADPLWDAFAAACPGAPVRFICPVPEPARTTWARSRGLSLHESWWLRELDGPGGGAAGVEITLPGAAAHTVAAPPVYAPPGPVLFVPGPVGDGRAVSAALGEAPRLGCAAVFVNQPAHDDGLAEMLRRAGLRRHCDFLTGVVA